MTNEDYIGDKKKLPSNCKCVRCNNLLTDLEMQNRRGYCMKCENELMNELMTNNQNYRALKLDKISPVLKFIEEMREIHERKAKDYSGEQGIHYNFEFAKMFADHFDNPIDKVFASIIGIKFARLTILLKEGKEPANEPIRDTFIDIANYVALWGTRRCL